MNPAGWGWGGGGVVQRRVLPLGESDVGSNDQAPVARTLAGIAWGQHGTASKAERGLQGRLPAALAPEGLSAPSAAPIGICVVPGFGRSIFLGESSFRPNLLTQIELPPFTRWEKRGSGRLGDLPAP